MSPALWEDIKRNATANRCRCALRAGMSREDLRPLGGGCTMPQYCCPTLDTYRRRLPAGPVDDGVGNSPTPVKRSC